MHAVSLCTWLSFRNIFLGSNLAYMMQSQSRKNEPSPAITQRSRLVSHHTHVLWLKLGCTFPNQCWCGAVEHKLQNPGSRNCHFMQLCLSPLIVNTCRKCHWCYWNTQCLKFEQHNRFCYKMGWLVPELIQSQSNGLKYELNHYKPLYWFPLPLFLYPTGNPHCKTQSCHLLQLLLKESSYF